MKNSRYELKPTNNPFEPFSKAFYDNKTCKYLMLSEVESLLNSQEEHDKPTGLVHKDLYLQVLQERDSLLEVVSLVWEDFDHAIASEEKPESLLRSMPQPPLTRDRMKWFVARIKATIVGKQK